MWCLNVQTAAEYEKRKEKFYKELDFVIADVVCFLFQLKIVVNFNANSSIGREV